MDAYVKVDKNRLQEHLIYFFKEIIPVGESCDVVMFIHPHYPPYATLGLFRVVCAKEDIDDLIHALPTLNNGLCF